MSRRPNAAAEQAAKNSAAIKSLLKLEANKICADCKRNKHPRWASWNIGIFVCIRCSGIHRGMGTHISRVKSVDLDSWTDEQLASIVSWGNDRAKRYWEAKLPPDHVPSEAKIENFIRTKYELKRWVMDGPIPDPAMLDDDDDNDDDVPSGVGAVGAAATAEKPQQQAAASSQKQQQQWPAAAAVDLIGGDPGDPIPARSNSGPPTQRVPSKAEAAPPKTTTATSTKDSLLGLDFFQPATPPRPASSTGGGGLGGLGGQSRPDLKQSILSLYASAPKQQPQQQRPAGGSGLGSMPSPTLVQGASGGISDAFGGLSLTSSPRPSQPADPFASLGGGMVSPKMPTSQPSHGGGSGSIGGVGSIGSGSSNTFGPLSGGAFFDSKPMQAAAGTTTTSPPPPQPAPAKSTTTGFGAGSSFGDLFDLSPPAALMTSTSTASPPLGMQSPSFGMQSPAFGSIQPPPTQQPASSVFNLSSQPKPAAASQPPLGASNSAAWSGFDVWGSANAWSSSGNAADPKSPSLGSHNKPAAATAATIGLGDLNWAEAGSLPGQGITTTTPGSFGAMTAAMPTMAMATAPPPPKVAPEEEFGGWTSSSSGPSAGQAGPAVKPAPTSGFGGSDDLFANVWQ